MVESKYNTVKTKEDDLVKMFWIIGNQYYERLREFEGLTDFSDLNHVPEAIEFIKKLFQGFGSNDTGNIIFLSIDTDKQEMDKTYKEILKMSRKLD